MTFTKRRYFLRYLLVFCVPILLMGSLLWVNNLWYAYQETASFRSIALSEMVEEMDTLNAQMQAVADKISINEEFVGAMRGEQEDYAHISQWLNLYESLFIDGITLAYYIPGDTKIIQKEAVIPYRDFESKYTNAANFSLAGYFKTLNQSKRPTASNLSREDGSLYAFSNTYPITNRQARHVGTLCFLVPRTILQSMFTRYFPDDSAELYIFDAANQPVFYGKGGRSKAQELSKKSGIGLVESKKEVILRNVSQQNRYSYFVVMARDDFYASGNTGMLFLYMFEAILLFFSAMIAATLTRSHYTKLQMMHRQNLKLEDTLGERQNIIRTLVLRKLIDGSQKDRQMIDYNLRCANIQFSYPFFFILVADFADIADEDTAIAAFYQMLEKANTIGTIHKELYIQTLARMEIHQVVIVINTLCNQRELANDLTELIIQKDMQISIGLSKACEDCLHLNNAYIEAVVAVNERLDAVSENFFLFNNKTVTECIPLIPPIELSIIQECIRNGNRELLREHIGILFQKIFVSYQHPRIVQLACYDVINFCIHVYTFFDVALDTHTILSLSDFESPQALADLVERLLFELCDIVQKRIASAEISTKYNLIGFVQENFSDSNLSLGMLADEFGLSHSYVSKLFKEETGQNFVSYVKQLRMSYAKKQLAETEKQVKDIIHDSGYVDVPNFTRIFKQEVGVTPLQYRQNIRRC